jgi:hypothetical protein
LQTEKPTNPPGLCKGTVENLIPVNQLLSLNNKMKTVFYLTAAVLCPNFYEDSYSSLK